MAGGIALSFAQSWLERSTNPRAQEVIRLIGRFSTVWAEELKLFLSEDERYSRINALLGIRNDIAHGRNQGVSRGQAWDYYQLVCDILEWVLDRLDPVSGKEVRSERSSNAALEAGQTVEA